MNWPWGMQPCCSCVGGDNLSQALLSPLLILWILDGPVGQAGPFHLHMPLDRRVIETEAIACISDTGGCWALRLG